MIRKLFRVRLSSRKLIEVSILLPDKQPILLHQPSRSHRRGELAVVRLQHQHICAHLLGEGANARACRHEWLRLSK